jgi:Ras-related GTP-binding protein A/B
VHTLIPNIDALQRHLAQFARICSATEVVLFEKSTFLVISRSTQQVDPDDEADVSSASGFSDSASNGPGDSSISELHGPAVPTNKGKLSPERFEKISELIKNLKSSCAKIQAQFQGLEIRGATYTAYLDLLTAHTYVMVIVADPRIRE